MPSFDYVGNAMQQSSISGRNPYTGIIQSYGIPGRGSSALSSSPYDPGSALGDATQAQTFDVNSAGKLGQLSDLVNTINRNAQQQSLQARIPGAPALEQQSSANIGSELQGQIPQDVMNLLGQQAAERGVATGDVGGPNANAAYLRALGLTSLGQQQVGQQNLSAAYGRNPAAPIFDPSSQLITPYQGALISEANNQNNLGVNQLLQRGNLAQQELYLDRLRYGNTGGYGQNQQYSGPTGGDVYGPDYGYSGGGGAAYGSPPANPLMPGYYDVGNDFGSSPNFGIDLG